MNFKIFHKLTSIFMALMVLTSTMSFAIEKHFCGDILVDASLFSEVKKCELETLEMEMAEINKKNCCKDTIDVVQGQDQLVVKNLDDLSLPATAFIYSFAYSFFNLFEGQVKEKIPHEYYSPPNLVIDIQVLDQVFLI